MGKFKSKPKLITHTGSHKKALINLEIAEQVLDEDLLKELNRVLIELNHIQETELNQIVE